jgi:hypothetical protein
MLRKAKFQTKEREPVLCDSCPRLTRAPKMGKCQACYLRSYRGSALPARARCERRGCHERNPIVLVRVGDAVRCYNCRALDRARAA